MFDKANNYKVFFEEFLKNLHLKSERAQRHIYKITKFRGILTKFRGYLLN